MLSFLSNYRVSLVALKLKSFSLVVGFSLLLMELLSLLSRFMQLRAKSVIVVFLFLLMSLFLFLSNCVDFCIFLLKSLMNQWIHFMIYLSLSYWRTLQFSSVKSLLERNSSGWSYWSFVIRMTESLGFVSIRISLRTSLLWLMLYYSNWRWCLVSSLGATGSLGGDVASAHNGSDSWTGDGVRRASIGNS